MGLLRRVLAVLLLEARMRLCERRGLRVWRRPHLRIAVGRLWLGVRAGRADAHAWRAVLLHLLWAEGLVHLSDRRLGDEVLGVGLLGVGLGCHHLRRGLLCELRYVLMESP